MNKVPVLSVVIVVFTVLVCPTPHTRFREFLVKTFDCSTTLQDGDSISQNWVDMQNITKIVIDLQSTEEVEVLISNQTVVLFGYNDTIHVFSGIFSSNSYSVSVINPMWSGTDLSAEITGSIKAYHFERETEWLPWWIP